MSDNKYIPIGVWIFWSVLGLFLLGLVGSFYPNFGGAFTFLISILSALGGAIAAVAAYLTVRELRQDREDERRHRRPYFSVGQSDLGVAWISDEEEADSITIQCRQVGINPAAEIKALVEVIQAHDLRVLTTLTHAAVDEYPTQAVFSFHRADHFLDSRFRHHYVVLKLDYKDAIYQTAYRQDFYFQWPGLMDEGNKSISLCPISKETLVLIRKAKPS